MSAIGPSLHFAAKQRFGRFRTGADIRWQADSTESVENDPERTRAIRFLDYQKARSTLGIEVSCRNKPIGIKLHGGR